MKLMVTGAGGGLGQEVPEVFTDDEIVPFSRNQLDVTDAEAVGRIIRQERPDVIIHAAAYTAVDQAESEPELARLINVDGTRNVTRAAIEAGAVVVYPSTDYVFDGRKRTPYEEEDETGPLNVYGRTKLEGEHAALANPRTFVLRTSWLYSQHGKSFATTMLRLLSERKQVRVVTDEISSPTYSRDYLRATKSLLETNRFGLYHLACEGRTSWNGFAKEIAALSGSAVPVTDTTAADYGLPAARPAFSKLSTKTAVSMGVELPHWKRSLGHFFRDRGRAE